MEDRQLAMKINVSILPFNEMKLVGIGPKLGVEIKETKRAMPKYELPKTAQPSSFEKKFDGGDFYIVPVTSG